MTHNLIIFWFDLVLLREGVQKIINYLATIYQMNMGRIGYYKENGIIINHIYMG